MRRPPKRSTLVRQYTRWLVALFIALELVTAAAVVLFIFMPIARRAADDLAGLMVLSAQTWVELPPETRPVFEEELARSYQIALRPSLQAAPDTGLRHGLYIRFLENAFERRLGHEAFFEKEIAADGSDWLWIAIPAGEHSIGAGFAMDRMEANPFYAFALALVVGTLLVLVLARWLASRIAQPISKFALAAAQLGTATGPDLLPETGPRELADLAHHFNQMAIQVRELSDARTTLFAGLSHDLRTPLARMRLALEILTLKPDPALLKRLDADIEEMNQLIGQLLEIARGLSTEPAQDLALCEWLQARTQEHRAAAAASGAQLIGELRGRSARPRCPTHAGAGARQPDRERTALRTGRGRGSRACLAAQRRPAGDPAHRCPGSGPGHCEGTTRLGLPAFSSHRKCIQPGGERIRPGAGDRAATRACERLDHPTRGARGRRTAGLGRVAAGALDPAHAGRFGTHIRFSRPPSPRHADCRTARRTSQ